ncbi:hypothetical protein OZ13_02215 [Xanthomonas cannabis pv. cannabis]|nr:hypothetical protein OZ13_02215 [Xanthomonas cannabis pv. cannabis]
MFIDNGRHGHFLHRLNGLDWLGSFGRVLDLRCWRNRQCGRHLDLVQLKGLLALVLSPEPCTCY